MSLPTVPISVEGSGGPRPRRSRPVGIWASVALAMAGLSGIALATSRAEVEATATTLLEIPERPAISRRLGQEGEWRLLSMTRTRVGDAHRVEQGYLLVDGREVALLHEAGTVSQAPLERLRALRGVISHRGRSVAFGAADTEPPSSVTVAGDLVAAVWIGDGDRWELHELPWRGVVRAMASGEEGLTAIGTAVRDHVLVTVVARSDDGRRWEMDGSARVPDSLVLSVEGGFLARDTSDGTLSYLFSENGRDWAMAAEHIIDPKGEVAILEQGRRHDSLRIAGTDLSFRPPTWPVAGIWREGERLWVHTPGLVWTSLDGRRWESLPLDEDHGVSSGLPTLLPMGDRALVAVSKRDAVEIVEWRPTD